MKKNSFLKVLLGMYLLVVILSWIIPAGSYTNGTYASAGVAAVGVVNLFRLPIMTLQTFIQYTLVFLSIGLVYGVLNKTGVYDNICKGIARYAERGNVRLGGIICNSRNVDRELDLLRAFTKELNTQLIYFVPRNNIVQQAEIRKKTVIEYAPDSSQAQVYRNLAQAIDENTTFTIPTPITQERLEEILIENGMMEPEANYSI